MRTLICILFSSLLLFGCGSGDPQQQGAFEVDGREPGRQQLRPIRPQESTPEDIQLDEAPPVSADDAMEQAE